MAADESMIVPVAPDDTVDAVLKKIHGTGATRIELLVPDDTAALQTPRGFERLRRALEADGIGLLVISSDDQTLEAARRNRIDTVGVQGARVQPAAPGGNARAGRSTPQAPTRPSVDARDAAFLDALDHVPPGERDADQEDADLYAALDELSDTFERGETSRRAAAAADRLSRDEDFATDLDDWSDLSGAETMAAPTPLPRARDAADGTPRRYSAADMEVSEDDLIRQRGGRRTAVQRARATPARGATAGRRRYDEEKAYAARRRSAAALLLPLTILVLLALALLLWLFSSRVTVTVSPPAAAVTEHRFTNEVIPLAGSGTGGTAVQATAVAADAEASVTGQVQNETMAPVGTAKGQVTIINTVASPITIPKGSQFIGKNDKGQEVRFTVDNDITVPGATTTSSLAGVSTTYGQVAADVTARSPGSASNVPENSITQLLIPGQQPLVSQNSNFIFQNAPIAGGGEAPQRIVTASEVQGVLQDALTQLYRNGIQQLQAQIDETKQGIDETTLSPTPVELESEEHYQIASVQPGIGETVDPANPAFTVTVRAHFSALATPRDTPVTKQLETVAPQYFAQRADRRCKPGEQQGTRIDAIHWDEQKLTIDGAISCTPAGGLPPETVARVEDAVRGQSREAAEASLRTLQQQGLIGDYTLPPGRSSFPRFDWLINVQVGAPRQTQPRPAGAPQPSTAQPQPTQATP